MLDNIAALTNNVPLLDSSQLHGLSDIIAIVGTAQNFATTLKNAIVTPSNLRDIYSIIDSFTNVSAGNGGLALSGIHVTADYRQPVGSSSGPIEVLFKLDFGSQDFARDISF